MRITVTLDQDVVQLIQDAKRRRGQSMKQVVNDALRSALPRSASELDAYVMQAHRSALRPGIDPTSMNRLVAELEDERFMEISAREAGRPAT